MEENMILNEDQKAILLKALEDIHFANRQLHESVKEDSLTKEMSKILPSLIEDYFSLAAKVLNYESHLLEEKEKRHAEIRTANQKIRELEEKLGSSRAVDGLKEQLEYLKDQVNKWWNTEGFNHISKERFTAYGSLRLQFCFMLDHFGTYSRTPVSDERNQKEHIQHLRDIGFEFADFEKSSSEKLDLIDNPNNRSLLTKMLKERFPSLRIHKWGNRESYTESDIFVIRHVDVTIYDLVDI